MIAAKLRRMPHFTVDVKIVLTREFRFRVWLAAQLVRLATFVMNGTANVDINGERQ